MSEVTIKVPTPLRGYVNGQPAVTVEATTVEEALPELADRDEELREQVLDDDGRLRRLDTEFELTTHQTRRASDNPLELLEGWDLVLRGSAESQVPAVSVEDLLRWAEDLESFRLVDVREPYEWEICNLGDLGAELIPQDELDERIGERRGGETVVVHRRSGGRSAEAVRRLQAEGIENALNLQGAILAWAKVGDR